jgi:glycosyltransferase involved in cell wall biosynthesis
MPTKLAIFSDSPSGPTGLGRFSRELATRIFTRIPDVFHVGTIGFNSQYSSRLPWRDQYSIGSIGPSAELSAIISDFFGGEDGILLSVLNPGWLDWLAHPESLTGEENEPLKALLTSGLVKRWIYAPIDAEGPNGLPLEITTILDGFDRRLFYTAWAADLYDRATERQQVSEHLPHGIQDHVFHPRDRKLARDSFMPQIARLPQGPIPDDVMLVGCVATSTPRKNWPLAFETVAKLVERGVNAILWAHTDSFYKCYDFHNLTQSFGLNHRVIPTKHYLSSDKLAWAYSACDVTLMPSSEGYGYPIYESLACGVPCLHHNYAGGAEWLPDEMKIEPSGWYYEGLYCHRRPIGDANTWATRVINLVGNDSQVSLLPDELKWDNLWPRWEVCLKAGIQKSPSDYSQSGDPYGIEKEYTAQSAAVDVRGNSLTGPRSIPTQAEADAIVEGK